MRGTRWLLLLGGMALSADGAEAQLIRIGPDRFGPPRTSLSSSNPSLRRSRVRITVGLLGSAYGLAPVECWPRVVRVRIYTLPAPPPIVVVVPRGFFDPPRLRTPDEDVLPVPGPEAQAPRVEVPRPPAPPDAAPRKEPPPPPAPPKEAAPAPPPKEEPRPAAKPRRAPEVPRPPAPAEDPDDELRELLDRGEEAFRNLEFGRAAQRFRQASRTKPTAAQPRFLLAQALLAQGKYHEAHDAVVAGIRLRPDWPKTAFRPLELYGEAVGEYPAHLAMLEQTLRRFPDDPVLLFLHAYQLWFDGRKDEARVLFRRALPRAEAPDVIDRFLRALPAEEL
jgi:outer membrane biosynthesis protein TonB